MRSRTLLLLLLPLLGACGQELTAGGYDGRVETMVVDEPGPGSAATTSPSSRSGRLSLMPQLGALPRGQVEVVASAVLVRDDDTVVPVAADGRRASLAIAAGDTASLDATNVAVGRYTKVRVTFRSVEANVATGLLVGALSVTGQIRVLLPQPVTIERAVQLDVAAGDERTLIIDLNSPSWLATADATLKTVRSDEFSRAVEVRVK